ncbi:hypothetical protein SBOR_8585 [Sclerotinia borealis F-4128]|uniref:Uncharacterized protein n=1 Tax=Sclerotinia borealis (strain F-4128) TaxID=1432307 RepID=W9C815_SCLBF|nr:hypothetical protein SBOR_8585 [Sclerotinia borealis F-4128]
MPRDRRFIPKKTRTSEEEMARRAREEERRIARVQSAASAHADYLSLRDKQELEGEREGRERARAREGPVGARPGPSTGVFGGVDREGEGEEVSRAATFGGCVGAGEHQMFTGLVGRTRRPRTKEESETNLAHRKARRTAYRARRKAREAKERRIARRIAAAPLVETFRNLRIAERVAAGGDPEDEEDEDEMEELFFRLHGEDEEENDNVDKNDDDDDDELGGAGWKGGMFGGGSGSAGTQRVGQPIPSGN